MTFCSWPQGEVGLGLFEKLIKLLPRYSYLFRAGRGRTYGLKLRQERFRWDIGKNFFPERVVRHWTRLPRAVGESPSLEGFKNRVDVAPGDMV